jgi:hypothetical protein
MCNVKIIVENYLFQLLQQTTPTTWCCHPRASRLGWCSLACKPPRFSSKHNDGHYGQTFLFLFHQPRGNFSKRYDLYGVNTCVLLFVQMNVVPSGIWKLLPMMNQTCGGLQFFSEVLANFFWFSHDVKQRVCTEFEGRPWNTSTGTPPMNSNDVN